MSTKPSTFLTGCVLLATCFLALSNGYAAQPERQMPVNTPFDPFPTHPIKSRVDKLLVYAYDADATKVPVKLLKLTNKHTDTVYPIMRDGNEAALPSNNNVGLYDPYDAVRREYRGFIGYKGADNKY